jgi:hypothetical protein
MFDEGDPTFLELSLGIALALTEHGQPPVFRLGSKWISTTAAP